MRTLGATVAMLLLSIGIGAPATAGSGSLEPRQSRPGVTPTSRCVTPSEYYALERFVTTREEAERILDWGGMSARKDVNTWRWRYYRGCNGTWQTSRIGIRYGNHGRFEDSMWVLFD